MPLVSRDPGAKRIVKDSLRERDVLERNEGRKDDDDRRGHQPDRDLAFPPPRVSHGTLLRRLALA